MKLEKIESDVRKLLTDTDIDAIATVIAGSVLAINTMVSAVQSDRGKLAMHLYLASFYEGISKTHIAIAKENPSFKELHRNENDIVDE